jgi:hypothetical protein
MWTKILPYPLEEKNWATLQIYCFPEWQIGQNPFEKWPEVSTTFPILSLSASLLFSLSLTHLSNTVISLSPGFPDPDPAYFLIADPVPELGI